MSTPVPPPASRFDNLPPVSLDFGAWLKFNADMNRQIRDLERRFFRPREHALASAISPAAGRLAPRKPR